VEEAKDQWPGVVVGDVLAVRRHPDAEKLSLVTVENGKGPLEVVCGAPNVKEGMKICFAASGVTLPNGLKLEKRKIRGVVSAGMVCSERELGLSDEHEGILVLDTQAPAGTPVRDVLPGGRTIEIPNTGITSRPDLWGHRGIARELGAILDRDLLPMDLGPEPPKASPGVEVAIEAKDLCARYLGWAIGGVKVGPSPAWLRRRLEDVGQRSINNVVDLTNFVQLECGQPLHAFDRRRVGKGRIVVRRARAGERVTTLDGVERALPEGSCVIADPERALAIAGVMGLSNSEVLADTTEIVLEVANFEQASIRKTALALDLRTDSATRFSKGLDPEGVPGAARRFLRLLQGICPAAKPLGGWADVHGPPRPPVSIRLGADFIPRHLGIPLAPDRVDGILARLGFRVARAKDALTVTVPSWRAGLDVSLPEDLVEEVGRIHGYQKLPPLPLTGALEPVPEEPLRVARRRAKHVLSAECGFAEIFSYPFTTAEECRRAAVEPGTLRLSNAQQPGLDLLATSLVPKLLVASATNLKYRDEVAIYLAAPVFLAGEAKGLPRETERLALAVARRGGTNPVYAVKGAVEALLRALRVSGARIEQREGPSWLHPGRAARVVRGTQEFGWLGEAHPNVARAFDLDAPVALAELDLEALNAAQGGIPRMKPISRFPPVKYDVAVVVDGRTPAREVEDTLLRVDPALVREVRLFDAYEGPNLPAGKRSLAFSLVFGSLDRTLEPKDVERLRDAVGAALKAKGWTLRS
ncbi:MAG TPA: phenylalanine--tRNA ligase subunit beta, partial [Planctomycetota bacterium]|nr:phenylalanine--tRNA ligase subunit beta [Planctomycetota bacterium]